MQESICARWRQGRTRFQAWSTLCPWGRGESRATRRPRPPSRATPPVPPSPPSSSSSSYPFSSGPRVRLHTCVTLSWVKRERATDSSESWLVKALVHDGETSGPRRFGLVTDWAAMLPATPQTDTDHASQILAWSWLILNPGGRVPKVVSAQICWLASQLQWVEKK